MGGDDFAISILGTVGVTVGGVARPITSATQRRILAVLAIHVGEVVSSSTLIDTLWPEDPPRKAAESLRNHLSRLRVTIGAGSIATRPPGYSLEIPANTIDLHRFAAIAQDQAASARHLDDALRSWRGDPLAEFETEHWARPTVVLIREARLLLQERRIEAYLADDQTTEAVAMAQSLCAAAPLRERAHWLVMTSLARCGRARDAALAYERFRHQLAEETGLAPSVLLHQLHAAVLDGGLLERHVRSASSPETPALLTGPPNSLPLTGRTAELEELRTTHKAAFVGQSNTVMIAGEPGIGKTRLVTEFARAELLDGSTVAVGRCDCEVALSYAPFRQIAHQLTGRSGAADRSSMSWLLHRPGQPSGKATTGGRRSSGLPWSDGQLTTDSSTSSMPALVGREDRTGFITLAENEFKTLHAGNAVRFGLRPLGFDEWAKCNKLSDTRPANPASPKGKKK